MTRDLAVFRAGGQILAGGFSGREARPGSKPNSLEKWGYKSESIRIDKKPTKGIFRP
jgi:hypothetical protein